MNIRAQRSQQKIMTALFSLLKTEKFNELSVAEIAANAEVSRKTFYRNFKTKRAVLDYYLKQSVDDYFNQIQSTQCTTFKDVILCFFTYWKSETPYMQLLNANQLLTDALNFQREYILTQLPQYGLKWHQTIDEELLLNLFGIGGIWNIYFYHLTKHVPIEPEYLANRLTIKIKEFEQYLD